MAKRLLKRFARSFTPSGREARGESGETLLEVLLALVVLSLASVALITAFGTSVKASAEHRSLSDFNTVLASSIATTTTTIQQDGAGVFGSCQPLSNYPSSAQLTAALALPGYTAAIAASGSQPAVEYSSDGTYSTTCTSDTVSNPQLINVVVTDTATGITQSNTVVVDNPTANQINGVSGVTANELVFITQPEGATVGNNFATQPQLEVEDNGVIVISDLSPITVTIASGPAGATLSNSCNGQDTDGIITYSGCSLNVIGAGYKLFASEPDPSNQNLDLTTESAPFSVYADQLNTPSVTAIAPSTTTVGAVNVTYTGAGNAPNGQAYSLKLCQDSAMSVNCKIFANFASGTDATGLTAGVQYWAEITATASINFLGSTSPPVGPALATVQLPAPGPPTLSFGPSSGSVSVVSFTGSVGAPVGQTYTALACTSQSMTGGSCVTDTNIVAGSAITGLSPGLLYYVELSASASSGYLASPYSTKVSQTSASSVKTPTGFSTSPSPTQAGAIVATFTGGGTPAPSSYTATVCADAAMSANCNTTTGYTSGAPLTTGITAGNSYYVTITAVSSTNGYGSATTAVSGPTLATVQLATPTNVVIGYGSAAGSVDISAATSNGPASQTYTVLACQTPSLTGNTCVTSNNYTLGSDIDLGTVTAGKAGVAYYAKITAIASPGYLASTASAIAGPDPETGQIGPPTNLIVTAGNNDLVISFGAPTGTAPAPLSYNVEVCTQANLGGTCVTHTSVVSGAQFTGLNQFTNYYVTVIAVAPVGYVNDTVQKNTATKTT